MAVEQDNAQLTCAVEAKAKEIQALKKQISAQKKKVKVLQWRSEQQQPPHQHAKTVPAPLDKSHARTADAARRTQQKRAWRFNVLQSASFFLGSGFMAMQQVATLTQLSPSAAAFLPEWCKASVSAFDATNSPVSLVGGLSPESWTDSPKMAVSRLAQSLPGVYALMQEALAQCKIEALAAAQVREARGEVLEHSNGSHFHLPSFPRLHHYHAGAFHSSGGNYSETHKNLLHLQAVLLYFVWTSYHAVPYVQAHKNYLLQRFLDLLHDPGSTRIRVAEVDHTKSSLHEQHPRSRGSESSRGGSDTDDPTNGHLEEHTPGLDGRGRRAVQVDVSPLQQNYRPDVQVRPSRVVEFVVLV